MPAVPHLQTFFAPAFLQRFFDVILTLRTTTDCLDAYPSLSSLNPLSSFFGTSHSRRLPVPRVKWADDRKVFQRIGSDKARLRG